AHSCGWSTAQPRMAAATTTHRRAGDSSSDVAAASPARAVPATGDVVYDSTRYVRPGWFTRSVFNPAVAFLTRRGVSVQGTRILEVRGRRSGELRRTVVNLLGLDGERYLMAPRGRTHWVANVRAADTATLRVGRRREAVVPVELSDAAKVPVLRAYLQQWAWEVGAFLEGIDATSSDEELAAIAPSFPVFRLTSA
ncbi:MAG: nitroreductase/quinone reductase family protein, partial [Microthrixaceae bacterium]